MRDGLYQLLESDIKLLEMESSFDIIDGIKYGEEQEV